MTSPSSRTIAGGSTAAYMSVATCADLTDCSVKTIRRLIASGELNARRVGPRLLRIPRSEVERVFGPLA